MFLIRAKFCSFGQPYQTCFLARTCVPRLLSRLYPRVVYVFVTHCSLLVEFDKTCFTAHRPVAQLVEHGLSRGSA